MIQGQVQLVLQLRRVGAAHDAASIQAAHRVVNPHRTRSIAVAGSSLSGNLGLHAIRMDCFADSRRSPDVADISELRDEDDEDVRLIAGIEVSDAPVCPAMGGRVLNALKERPCRSEGLGAMIRDEERPVAARGRLVVEGEDVKVRRAKHVRAWEKGSESLGREIKKKIRRTYSYLN